MKTQWIPFLVSCVVVAFMFGMGLGQTIDAEHNGEQLAKGGVTSTTIAVVNSDVGVLVDNAQLNYSAAIIDTMGDGFTLVSPAMAQNGLIAGSYGAVITFPSDVSERIVSYNAENPERVQLDFQINPNLSEPNYIDTYVRIQDLQMSINTTLAQTYVSSIYDQLHKAQDQVEGVFANNQASLDALEAVQLEDFSPSLELETLPDIPLEPNEAETDHYLGQAEGFAAQVASVYQSSYLEASTDFQAMRLGLTASIGEFNREKEEWINTLDDWGGDVVDCSNELEGYASALGEHEEALSGWRDDILKWASEYCETIGAMNEWHESLDSWGKNVTKSIGSFCEELQEAHAEAEQQFNSARGNLTKWREKLEKWLGGIDSDDILKHINKRPSIDDFTPCAGGHGETCDTFDCYDDYLREMESWESKLKGLLGSFSDSLAAPPSFDDGDWLEPDKSPYPKWDDFGCPGEGLVDELPEYKGKKPPDDAAPGDFCRPLPEPPPPVSEPPELEGFWDDDLLSRLNSFEFEDYLSDSALRDTQALLGTFGGHLDFIREDLGRQFQSNIFLMSGVRSEYSAYLSTLRRDALAAEKDSKKHLGETLDDYSKTVGLYNDDTAERLNGFVGMMPTSRTNTGINQGLVAFTVAPFEFVTPAQRIAPIRETAPSWMRSNAAYLAAGAAALPVICGGYAVFKGRRNHGSDRRGR